MQAYTVTARFGYWPAHSPIQCFKKAHPSCTTTAICLYFHHTFAMFIS